MTKNEFLSELEKKLSVLPKNDAKDHILFYSEMIDDIMEDGKTEEEAVLEIGDADNVSAQIIKETPLYKIAKEKVKKVAKNNDGIVKTTLIILGFPIWFPLIISAFAVVFSLYVSLWAVIITLLASVLAFAVFSIGCVVMSVYTFIIGNSWAGIVFISFSLILIGLSIFIFYLAKTLTKFAIYLVKKVFVGKGE